MMAMAVTAAASNPTLVYLAMAACLACHGSPLPRALAAAAKPSRSSLSSCSLRASHAGSSARHCSPGPFGDISSRTE